MEILYRTTRQGFTQGSNIAFQAHPAAKTMFEALVQKPARVREKSADANAAAEMWHLACVHCSTTVRLFSVQQSYTWACKNLTASHGVRSPLAVLLQDVDSVGLAKELRLIVNTYNAQLGQLAR